MVQTNIRVALGQQTRAAALEAFDDRDYFVTHGHVVDILTEDWEARLAATPEQLRNWQFPKMPWGE